MAFIIKKNIKGHDYYYLRKSIRDGDKVISKCIAYLGKDKAKAEEKAKKIIEKEKRSSSRVHLGSSPKESHLSVLRANKQLSREHHSQKKKNPNSCKPTKISIEDLANFCKQKGFVFRSSDIYGGYAGFWEFGPLGVELFKNIKQDWWNHFVYQKTNMVGIDASIISHPRTWKASGHIENFNDLMIYCNKHKKQFRVDHLIEEVLNKNVEGLGKEKILEIIKENMDIFSKAGYDLADEIKPLNLMFKTNVGSDIGEGSEAYLRGETAQGMFMDFKLIHQTSRMQLPFGIAQIGRCFRNEIAPRDFLFRSREFHIGEFEFFIHPDEKKCELLSKEHLNVKFMFLDEETQKQGSNQLKKIAMKELLDKDKLGEWHAYWLAEQIIWFRTLGLDEIKIREHTKDELSHYSSATFDIDYEYPFGSKEVAGNANRGQYDLRQHEKESKQSMAIFDEKTGKKVVPRVIEPTFGMERVFLAILTKAYCDDIERGNIVLRIPAWLAPIKVAVFPIVKGNDFEKFATEVVNDLGEEFNVSYDKSGSIGRRYARNDEIGTPYCVTVDGDSLKNKDVTIRDRNTTQQIRVKISELKDIIRKLINSEIEFEKAGKVVK